MRKVSAAFLVLALVLTSCATVQAKSGRTQLLITAPSDSVFVGDTLQLEVTSSDTATSLEGLTYSVSSEKTATVDAKGQLTALKRGRVNVTVKTADGKVSGRKTFTVMDRPQSVTIKAQQTDVVVGKSLRLTASVLPRTVADRTVTWESGDANLATVSERGTVKGIAPGKVTIRAISKIDTSVAGEIELEIIRLASAVTFSGEEVSVLVPNTLQLAVQVAPADVSSTAVKYSSSRPKVATVDENGIVTALKAGKATIKAQATDGSRKAATILVKVLQPLEGVHLKHTEIRIGVGSYSTVEAILEPKDASDVAMTWTSSDETIATIKGNTNRVRVSAHAWGTATVTGITEDGGYSVSLQVHGGSYRYALRVESVKISAHGQPRLVFGNLSNLEMQEVRFVLKGTDAGGKPVQMSTSGDDVFTMSGRYSQPLAPDERTEHGLFKFINPTGFEGLMELSCAITGFTTADGFKYNIDEEKWTWVDSK